ncbi:MAG: hypothetical protein EPN23_08110 [Verrucomicrobia bacterium]|nr:MAG: hypothetical protein EPN23_08110 [Verrucomicrobiota bacterium]
MFTGSVSKAWKTTLGWIGLTMSLLLGLRAAEAPIIPDAKFALMPFGAVRPAGWIKAQIDQDASSGILAYYHRCWMVQNKAYELRGHNPAKQDKQSDFWDGAAEGYWGLALISNAILADDAALKKRADEFVAAMLKSQDADGYLGIYDAQKRYTPAKVDRTGHIGFMLQGLLDYVLAYNRKDVLAAVERAVQCDMRHFNRTTTNLHAAGFMVMSVTVKTKNPDQPWQQSPLRLEGLFKRMRSKYKVDLVPMGCTVLRRVTFPVGYVYATKKKGTMVDENTSE